MLKKFGAKSALLILTLATAAFSFSPASEATPVTYDFTVHVVQTNSSVFKDSTLSGSFAYDSSSIIAGNSNRATDLLTALDFTFNGVNYTSATANTGRLTFDSSGALTDFMFGTNCTAGNCGLARSDSFIVTGTTFSFYARTPAIAAGTGTSGYALAPVSVPVPEPGALGMMGLGVLLLAGLAGARRRVR